ncbi:MAG: CRISPR system precrRNA processing endoribonuclease RAMP protein Cas6 [Pirellulaceae bacterium]|nr:CRISPR system precrRNA processing endoribonuclease RAMP protein Cas6 [Pirellulaceae bacterium]
MTRVNDDEQPGLVVKLASYRLLFLNGGRLLPWLGPALKGIIARHFKTQSCHWPAEVRDSQWRYCRGCQHLGGCGYGLLFEPDPPVAATVMPTARDGQRAITLAAQFPAPERIERGDTLDLQVLLLGEAAADREAELLQALQRLGPAASLGRDRIGFRLAPAGESHSGEQRIAPGQLRVEDTGAPVSRLVIRLDSPLLLRTEGDGHKKTPLRHPEFADLLRGSLRTVGRAFEAFGSGDLCDVDFAALKQTAENVVCRQARWQPFTQPHHSQRSQHRWNYEGVTGWAEFQDVPRVLLPWLIFGGALGVGQERLCGAGRWTVIAERSEV